MRERASVRMRWPDLLGLVASLAVLVACLYYGFVGVLLRPDLGFQVDNQTAIVKNATPDCGPRPDCVRQGDRILRLRGVPFEEYIADRTLVLYDPLRDLANPIPVKVERAGKVISVVTVPRARSFGSPLSNVAMIVIPLVFWLVGTLAVVFLRPRDTRWLVFVAWSLLTALWFAAGFTSETHLGYSSIVLHAAIWLWIATMLHLHLLLPRQVLASRATRIAVGALYVFCVVAAILDLGARIPGTTYALPTLAAIGLSFGLLLRHIAVETGPALRRASRLMAFGVGVGCLPVIAFALLPIVTQPVQWTPSVGAQALIALLALISIPLWPLSYLQALHRADLGAFSFRGNRLLGTHGFLTLVVFGYLSFLYLATVALRVWLRPGDDEIERELLLVAVFSSLVVIAAAAPLRSAFQRWVDRRIFGIHYSPEEVVEAMAAKLPGAVDGQKLRAILTGDLLPTLLVRRSAIYLVDDGGPRTFLTLDAPEGCPPARDLDALWEMAGEYLPRDDAENPLSWVRLVVPLETQGRRIGVWLFGRRDPDDFYSRSDIDLLRKLGNQVAVVLGNQREMEERRNLQQHLLEVQKMEALGRLAAGVAHDFNNLLAVMLVATEMAQSTAEAQGEVHELLGEVATACNRASKLTKQLLTFSRRQTFDSQIFDLDDLVRDNLPILRTIAGGAVDLELALEAGPTARVEADPAQIDQVLLNLAINAVDAMPDGGVLTISTRCVSIDAAEESKPRTPPPGDYLLWTVEDTGSGIEPEVLPHIFEPFFTTRRAQGGTGLGLSLVYGIVQQSGGHTFVRSRPGHGARFEVYLPLVEACDTETEGEGDETGPPESLVPGLRVLLVEDERNVRSLVSRMLRSWQLEVVEASNGQEALNRYGEESDPIDILLTDLVMPELGGYELARRLTASRPGLPVLYMSGFVPEDTIGDDDADTILLTKPFTARDLRDGLSRALLRARDADARTGPPRDA